MTKKMSVAFDASEHRNIIVPSSVFYDDSKEYRVLVDSAFGKAEVRLAFGQRIEITESSSDESEYKTREVTAGTQDSEDTVAKTISPEKAGQRLEEQDRMVRKRKKKSFWPGFIDESTFLRGCSRNHICTESFCNDMNKSLVMNLMKWKDLFMNLVKDVKARYPFGDESCKEQVAMVAGFNNICNNIAASGLLVFLMGARQIVRNLEYPETLQEAELVEDIAEFNKFELTAHMSPCHTTFFVVTTYRKCDVRKHVIYGVFPRYQPQKPCPVELMVLRSSQGYEEV